MRPTLAEYVLEMPRGAQVIYPKDLGPILMLADVFPGARVLESGVGSGALTIALLRAIGPTGHVTGYEIRDDFAAPGAGATSKASSAPTSRSTVEVRDVYDGIERRRPRPVLLDLPEPWRVVKHAEQALHPGGILLAYLPTIGQVARLREELAGSRVRHGRDARGAAAHLARRRPVGPTRPPHGGAHRLPHPRRGCSGADAA